MGQDNHFTVEDVFNFSCHEGLECFNTCCRDISIFLSPYDVLRLKNSLGLTSQEFLDKYTHRIDPGPRAFPMVMINMDANTDKRCPFITERGCGVYQHRPWSCRMAPVDIRGDNIFGFCFDSSRCHGLKEKNQWTVNEWADNQGVKISEPTEADFKEIPKNLKFTGLASIDKHIKDMFVMACYNVDKFRKYVLDSSFVEVFNVPEETVNNLKSSDVELMKFGFRWLAYQMDIRKSMEIRDEVFGA